MSRPLSARAAAGAAGLVALAFTATRATALDPGRAPSQYARRTWTVETGFPGGAVHAFGQGKDGFLWIGTESGLYRFDGKDFEPVAFGEAARREPVLGLVADGAGDVWARLETPPVLRLGEGRFLGALPALDRQESAVTAMAPGRNGSVLITGLLSGALRYGGGVSERLAPGPALPAGVVMAMAETSDGRVWLGTRDAGLFFLRGGVAAPVTVGLPDTKVNCLLSQGRELWVGTDAGVVRWTGRALTRDGVPRALASLQALAMIRDRDGIVWIGTPAGLIGATVDGRSTVVVPLPGGAVTALFEDREGNVWLGGPRGIEQLRDPPFVTFGPAEGLPSPGNGSVLVDGTGRTWFAPGEGGLYLLDAGRFAPVSVPGLGHDVVYSIADGPDGLWLGRRRGGLTRLRVQARAVTATTFSEKDGLAQDSVYAVLETREGAVLAGTLSAGLARLAGGRFTRLTTADGLPSNAVSAIAQTTDGTVWLGTSRGLVAVTGDGIVAQSVAGRPFAPVNCLFEDREGVLWVGTGDGLAFADSSRSRPFRPAPRPRGGSVRGIAEDGLGFLWMTTSTSVLRVRREALLRGDVGDDEWRVFGRADGLAGLEGVRRHPSVVADRLGRVWLATTRGLSVADPRRADRESAPTVVHVASLSADGRQYSREGAARVSPGPQRVSLQWSGVSLSVPERVRFRYRLDGFDDEWSPPVAVGEASYTNLAPGPYRFRVLASNRDGLWNGAETAVPFVIASAAWQTWWFRAAAVLAAGLAAALAFRWRLQRESRRLKTLFEERLGERLRIAQDLHDTLLQGLVSASMQLHVAGEELPPGSAATPRLLRVQRLMQELVDQGRDTVRGLRSAPREKVDVDLAEALARVREEVAPGDGAELRVIVEGTPRPMNAAIRDEVYRIGREALVNALRHARAAHVEVEIDYAARELRLLVRDDGVGIDPDVLGSDREGHFGMSGMRERAERIGGQLAVWSRKGAGTEVTLVLRSSTALGGGAAPARPLARLWSRIGPRRPGGSDADAVNGGGGVR